MKVSIITVVFNNKDCIAGCIESVLAQTYNDVEHIVIDGGSTDGTQQQIEPYKNKLAYYLSERDSGIFEAYNKGIKKATGDIIGVLNSDDFFYEPGTIEKIVTEFRKSETDLVYAKGLFVNRNNKNSVRRIYPSNPFKKSDLLFGWIPLHPTIYVKREVYEKYGLYDQSYSIASDYEISLRWFKNDNIKKRFLNQWVVIMRMGGKSTTVSLQKRKSSEDYRIIQQYKLKGLITLGFKIGRKIPHYIIPQLVGSKEFL